MSNFTRYTGYIYPLPQMTDEERFEYLGKVNEEATFDLDADKFMTEQLGDNNYLLWVTSSSYGKESGEFGSCRPCNQKEIYYNAPKFREILGEIDTAKLKYIDFCYYNSTECTTDYYLVEEEYKPMTLEQAISHAKEVAASKCDECGKEHQQLAEWLQELVDLRTKIKRLGTELRAKHLKAIHTANELAAYKDKTYISEDFLIRNGFEKREYDYLYCNDVEEISAQCIDAEMGIWRIYVGFLESGNGDKLDICTVGQMRMFLAICGLDNIVEQFK